MLSESSILRIFPDPDSDLIELLAGYLSISVPALEEITRSMISDSVLSSDDVSRYIVSDSVLLKLSFASLLCVGFYF